MSAKNKCPECSSEAIGIEIYEEFGGPETVNVCQICGCRFFHKDMIQSHGNSRAGQAMMICDMLTGSINLEWLYERLKDYKKLQYQ